MAIDIGSAATDRAGILSALYTLIDKANPADGTGIITSVQIWCNTNLTGCIVGTFYLTGADKLKCRASAAIGNVTAGSKQTFSGLSIAVAAGDYIGIYFATGGLDYDSSGGTGLWYISGQYIDPNDETTYYYIASYVISVYGTGVAAAVGRSFGFIIG